MKRLLKGPRRRLLGQWRIKSTVTQILAKRHQRVLIKKPKLVIQIKIRLTLRL